MKWYKDDPIRFEMERKLLAQHHSGCRIVIEGGIVRVEFTFQTYRDCYEMEGYFPEKYPYSPMNVFVKSPKLEPSPHIYRNGALCLHGSDDVGPETTAKVYLDWAKQWILTYEKWLTTGDWPLGNKGK